MEETLELLGEDLEAFRAEASASTQITTEEEPRKRFKPINRNQLMIRPVDIEKLVKEDDPVRAIWAMVCELDWSRFEDDVKVVEGGKGRSNTDPRLLAALWIYAYSEGVNSARELSRMCCYEPGCQWLTGMEEVNYHTLSDFRTKDKEAQDDVRDAGRHQNSSASVRQRRLSIKLCLRSCQASRSKRVSKMALSWSRASWTRPLTLYQRPFSNEVIVKPSFIFRVSSDWK